MPRRREVPVRKLMPDPIYTDAQLTRFMNAIMNRGKKSLAEKIVYGAFDIIADKTKDDPMKTFKKALKNASPLLEVKSRRVGGANYQVPVEIRARRQEALAIRWLIGYSRDRKTERTMQEKLAMELMDAAENKGAAVKKKEDTHRMAEANKAFAHYRW
jgi:small subunit ribosomal protein S7